MSVVLSHHLISKLFSVKNIFFEAADPTLVPLLWDENSYQAKPKIGFYSWQGSTFGFLSNGIFTVMVFLRRPLVARERSLKPKPCWRRRATLWFPLKALKSTR